VTRRRLRPEERELWQKVAHTATPLPEALRREKKAMKAPIRPSPDPEPVALSRAFGIVAKNRQSLAQDTAPQKTGPVMDKKTFGKMRRGKLVPEARIDLHGMTLDQAHPALSRFILTTYARGFRLVLVITGKGQQDDGHDFLPRQRGVLKRQVPMWLRMAPLNSAVLDVSEAHVRHGGGGAFYVYLRRSARS
jgi:DNA-nicking Smr family endonuclease